MTSKHDILASIRKQTVPAAELPNLSDVAGITFANPQQQFAAILEGVGGLCHHVADVAGVNERLATLSPYTEASQIISAVPGVGQPNVDIDTIDDPHDLHTVDFAIFRGEFAVAENAAVWMTDHSIRHRVAYFIPQHLAFVLPSRDVVNNMHEAYERLRFDAAGYGVFISGPSKTADIEQSLVIGAHGARSLHVFLVDSLD